MVFSGAFTVTPDLIPDSFQMLLSLFGIVTFLIFICTLALNIALQVKPVSVLTPSQNSCPVYDLFLIDPQMLLDASY